jgi:hypothetical protein
MQPGQLYIELVLDLGRHADGFHQFFLAHELIPFHRHGNFEFGNIHRSRWLHASQYFSQTPDSHRGSAARQRNQILDAPPHFDIVQRDEADAARADIPRLFGPVHPLIPYLNNLKGELEFVSLSTSLFQDLYSINIFILNQWLIVPLLTFS